MNLNTHLLGPALVLLVAGCTAVGPDPAARARLDLPTTYAEGAATPAGKLASRAFWTEYREPVLNAPDRAGAETEPFQSRRP